MKTKLFFLLITISLSSFSQDLSLKSLIKNPKINFYDVVKQATKLYKHKAPDKFKEDSEYDKFMRWVYENEYKYYPTGDRTKEDPLLLKHAWEKYLKSVTIKNLKNKVTLNNTNNWEEIGPRYIDSITNHYSVGLGRVIDVLPITQDTIFLSSEAGGLWKSTNGGETWSPKSDVLIATGADALAFSPFNHSKMYMDVQNPGNYYSYGIYRSDDGGETWYESNFNPENVGYGGLGDDFIIYTIKCHPDIPDMIFIGTNKGLYISSDDLETWTRITDIFDNAPYGFVKSIAFHPTDSNTIYIMDDNDWITKDNIFISNDLGETWHASGQIVDADGNANNKNGYLDTSLQCEDCVYFASDQGVWKSVDKGENFTFISKPEEGMVEGFAVNKDNPDNMLYGYVNVMKTADGGANWTKVTEWSLGGTNGTGETYGEILATATDYVHADLHPVKYLNGNFYIGTDGFMCKSSDEGDNWKIINYGTGIRENYRLGVGQNNMNAVLVGSQDNGGSFYTEHGWVEISGGDGMEGLVLPLNENAFIGSYQHGSRYRSFDEGITITQMTPPATENAGWVAPIQLDPNDHLTLYDFRDGVWTSNDLGENWTQLNADLFGTGYWDNISVAEVARNNSQIMLVGNRSSLKKSTDGGNTFTDITGLPDLYITDVSFDPKNDETFFATYGNYDHSEDKIYMTTDGGSTWENITYNLENIPVHSILVENTPEHYMYAGTELGVFYKGFNDTNWQILGTNLPRVKVNEMEIQEGSNYLYITSWGRGLWRIKLPGKENYPEIEKVSITNPPTLTLPKEGMSELVTTVINYSGTLSSVEIKYSVNNNSLDQTITMSNTNNNIWVSDEALPTENLGDIVYFKVIATGSNNDVTETYTYMYHVHEFEYCEAAGDHDTYDLSLENVTLKDSNDQILLDNDTGIDEYTYYETPVIELHAGETYTINTLANHDWGSDDHLVWIDYNYDAEFTDDELILYDLDSGEAANAEFTVPNDAVKDKILRMRVRLGYYDSSHTPCGTSLGEVEDYNVKIVVNDSEPPVPDVDPLPDVTAECEVTEIDPPTATDNVDGVITGTTDATFSITTQGTTVITWTYTDSSGNTTTQTQNVIIDDVTPPVPDADELPDVTAECEVTELQAPTATDNCAENVTVTNDASLPITTQGTTVVTWTYDDGNGNITTQTQNVIITPIDNTITQENGTLIANATGNYTYQWGECNGEFSPIEGETEQSFTPSTNGDYAVIISNGTCEVTSECINISSTNDSLIQIDAIKIYPNPSTGKLYIEMDNYKNSIIYFYDVTGKIIANEIPNQRKSILNIEKFDKGIYLLKIQKSKKTYYIRIIKQ